MREFTDYFLVAVLAGGIRAAIPLYYAALGEVFCERAGIINLGLEGLMLVGCVVAVIIDYHTGSVVLSIMGAMLVSSLFSSIHAVLSIRLRANQIAAGIAMIILGTGVSSFIGVGYVGKKIAGVSRLDIPFLGDIPFIGPIFFQHDIIIYFAYLLLPVSWYLMYKTSFGLQVRAVGDDPRAAARSGINVNRVRFTTVLIGGAFCGLAGAYLSLAYTQLWVENMVAGRGLIALALVIFAVWNPFRVAVGAFLFGSIGSLQLRLQAAGYDISPYLLSSLPYIFTIIVLVYASGKMRVLNTGIPRALGKPFKQS